jgi:hypothetical protein
MEGGQGPTVGGGFPSRKTLAVTTPYHNHLVHQATKCQQSCFRLRYRATCMNHEAFGLVACDAHHVRA